MTQAASSTKSSSPGEAAQSRGLLEGVAPHEVIQKGIDLFDPSLTVEALWGSTPPSGGALLEAVLAFYSDGCHDVPWYYNETSDGGPSKKARSIVRSPLSRELQEATVQSYADRVIRESISQVAAGQARVAIVSMLTPAAGEPIFKFRTMDRVLPCEAGTYNHRAEAVYRASEIAPTHPNVAPVLERGLKAVKFVHPRIPDKVWHRFIVTHNSFHTGSGENFLDYLQESITMEADWELETARTGLYFRDWDAFRKALSLAHMLRNRFKVWEAFRTFCNSHVDFLGSEMDPAAVIASMHQLALLVIGNMAKYYSVQQTAVMLLHSLKHCVPKATGKNSSERLAGWTFKHWEQDSARMNLFNLPMTDSAVVKKLTVQTAEQEGAKTGKRAQVCGDVRSELAGLGVRDKKARVEAATTVTSDMPAPTAPTDAPQQGAAPSVLGGADGSDSIKPTELKLKKSDKKSAFVPFSMEEKKMFRKFIVPTCPTEDDPATRALTALDDFMQAMKYAEHVVKELHGDDVPKDSLDNTFSFCAGLFLQFVFDGRVCLSGKDLRVWTGARAELQATYVAALDFMRMRDNATESSAAGPSGADRKVGALDLAKMLCDSYVNIPVQTLVLDADESQSLRRVATIMSTQFTDVVQPLREFLAKYIKLPVLMHDTVRDTLSGLMNRSVKRMDLVDLICFIQGYVEAVLPFQWTLFATDVAELFAARGHFVERTDEAISPSAHQLIFVFVTVLVFDQASLATFLSFRLQYLARIISSACTCVPELVLTNVGDKTWQMLSVWGEKVHESLDILVPFDSMLSAADWAPRWAEVLQQSETAAEINREVASKVAVSQHPEASTGAAAFVQIRKQPEVQPSNQGGNNKGDARLAENPGKSEESGRQSSDSVGSVSVTAMNDYVSEAFKESSTASAECKALGLSRVCAKVLKKLECKLNAAIWDVYESCSSEMSGVHVNIKTAAGKGGKDAVQVNLPIPEGMRLPSVHRLSATKGPKAIWCCKIFGVPELKSVDFFMEACKDCLTTDVCVPAWSSRPVSRNDQAFFEAVAVKQNVIMFMTGPGDLDFDVKLLPASASDSQSGPADKIKEEVGSRHVVVPLTIQCLVPVPDLQDLSELLPSDKLDKDLKDQRDSVEKQIRNWITTATKAKAKAVKSKRKHAAANDDSSNQKTDKTTVAMFETLGLDMPADKDEQIACLNELKEQEVRFESLVQKARDAIQMPSAIPLTRLQGDDDKSRNVRAKLMQEALEQAQKEEQGGGVAQEEWEASRFGAVAAVKAAQQGAGVVGKDAKDWDFN
ncbi:unnamed protein product [Symbiodinium sp. CCMP2592]|nr:unnamed protein product [Symbiodinium sp. CCMP2592]